MVKQALSHRFQARFRAPSKSADLTVVGANSGHADFIFAHTVDLAILPRRKVGKD
jgi:hypothetical protein